jgi:anaerobic ribonucleoside-triphosphate reductase
MAIPKKLISEFDNSEENKMINAAIKKEFIRNAEFINDIMGEKVLDRGELTESEERRVKLFEEYVKKTKQ